MRPNRKLLAVLASAVVLASPSAALAQSAGDEQYADPLAGDDSGQPAKDNSGGQDNTTGQGDTPDRGNDQPADSGTSGTAAPGADSTAAPQARAGAEQLPRTGLEVVMFVVTGAVFVLTGTVMQRIASRPASRTL